VSSAHRSELRTCPRTTPTLVRWYRSRAVVSLHTGRRRPTKASWSSPRRATSRSVGRAGPVFVTAVRAGWFRGRSSTDRSHLTSPPTATFSFAAHNQSATSSSICENLTEIRFPTQVLSPSTAGDVWSKQQSGVTAIGRPRKRLCIATACLDTASRRGKSLGVHRGRLNSPSASRPGPRSVNTRALTAGKSLSTRADSPLSGQACVKMHRSIIANLLLRSDGVARITPTV
jgi:hypothetical protein